VEKRPQEPEETEIQHQLEREVLQIEVTIQEVVAAHLLEVATHLLEVAAHLLEVEALLLVEAVQEVTVHLAKALEDRQEETTKTSDL